MSVWGKDYVWCPTEHLFLTAFAAVTLVAGISHVGVLTPDIWQWGKSEPLLFLLVFYRSAVKKLPTYQRPSST